MPLNEDEREIFKQLYEDGFSYEELASVFNMSPKSMSVFKSVMGLTKEVTCPGCLQKHTVTKIHREFCEDCKRVNRFRYEAVMEIRSRFYRIYLSNPGQAKEDMERMVSEDGKEFTRVTLGSVYEIIKKSMEIRRDIRS